MKKIILSTLTMLLITGVAIVGTNVAQPSRAFAKRAKWYCVALDPTTPWVQTCYSTTARP